MDSRVNLWYYHTRKTHEELRMSESLTLAEERWLELWSRIMQPTRANKRWARDQFRRMRRYYEEAHRKYHTLEHIEYGLPILEEYAHLAEHYDALLTAWFLHDVVYSTKPRTDRQKLSNEVKSARYANCMLYHAPLHRYVEELGLRSTVFKLICSSEGRRSVNTQDAKLLSDVDWSILGQPWEVYRCYVAKVRHEYGQYNDQAFMAGRMDWIRSNRNFRFFLPKFAQYNAQAKENLERELAHYEANVFVQLWELP